MYGSIRTLEDVKSQAIRIGDVEAGRGTDPGQKKERIQTESEKRQKKGEKQECHAGGQLQVVID
jgi:hypothetical protein